MKINRSFYTLLLSSFTLKFENMKLFAMVLCTSLLLVSCNSKTAEKMPSEEKSLVESYEKLKELSWLIGEWTNTEDNEFSKETWTRKNDSTFSGFSYTQVENDTVFAEELLLSQKAEEVYLTVVAYGQNNDTPITFTRVSTEENAATFENKLHDFPQRIVYTQPTSDSIHAWVEGDVNGAFQKIDFYFKKNERFSLQ